MITEYRRKDGSTFPVESRRSLLDTPQGRVLVVNSRDLSERTARREAARGAGALPEEDLPLGQAALAKRNAGELIAKAVQSVLEGLGGGAVGLSRARRRRARARAAPGRGPRLDADRSARRGSTPGSALAPVLDDSQPVVLNGPWDERCRCPSNGCAASARMAAVAGAGRRRRRAARCARWPRRRARSARRRARFLGAAASMVSAALHRLDSEARLAYLAQFDPLTGLPNRTLLADRFALMIVQARRRNVSLGVLFIDLDDFKLVNDTQGHAAGDELLQGDGASACSRRCATATPWRASAATSSPSILGDLARPDDAALVAQKILERVSPRRSTSHGQEAVVTASIGIATFPADGDNAEALLGAADAAMYRAKQSGRNAFQFFTADINTRTRARAQLGLELRRALERARVQPAYQPKIDLASGQPCGAEALLRWNHPERGLIAPVRVHPGARGDRPDRAGRRVGAEARLRGPQGLAAAAARRRCRSR